MFPGTIDDFVAQRIEYYRELIAVEQNPVTKEKYLVAIHALSKAPRQIDKLENAYLNKKMEFSNTIIGSASGIYPPSIANDLLLEIEEYKWLLAQLGIRL